MWIKKFIGNANYKRFLNNLKTIAKEEKKIYFFLLLDYLFLLITRGFVFNDYLNYKLYSRSRKEKKEYVSVKDQDKFYEKVSPSQYKNILSIKSNFMVKFKDYVKRDFIYKDNSFEDFLKFISKHDEIIVKPIDGIGGAGISKIKTKTIKNPKLFYKNMIDNNYLLEELIIQHPKMAEFSKTSVNTLRVMTSNINNNPKILFIAMRVGNAKNSVDNFHQGGMAALIDTNKGIVVGNAIDKDLNEYDFHPVTKKKFNGFKIPYYNETIKMALEAATIVPELKCIGWDIAITSTGPVFIEGNRRAGFDIVQVTSQRGRKDIIRDVLKNL